MNPDHEMTNAALMREIRKPGAVYVAALIPNDTHSVQVVKADLLAYLADLDPEALADWGIYGRDQSGIYLDARVE